MRYGLHAKGVRAGGFDLLQGTLDAIANGDLDFTIDLQALPAGFYTVIEVAMFKLSGGLASPADINTGFKFVTKAGAESYRTTKSRYEGTSAGARPDWEPLRCRTKRSGPAPPARFLLAKAPPCGEALEDGRDLTCRKVEHRVAGYDIWRPQAARITPRGASAARAGTPRGFWRSRRCLAMLEQDAGRKGRPRFAAPSALETGPRTNDPQQGARLIRAFLRIADPRVRLAIVEMVENMQSAPANC